MKTVLIFLASFAPLVGYILYIMLTRIPGSGIDYIQIFIGMILGGGGYALSEYLLKKQK